MPESTKPDRIGQFEILAELGPWVEGGTVYRAKDAKERPVLLRTLRLDAPGAAQKLMLISLEAKAASALASPNIAGVLGGGKAGDLYVVGWEFVEGVKFSTTLAKGETFSPSEITDLCRQICLALDHATSKNVVHPEFKPGNILIEWDGTAKLLDYGVPRRPIGNEITDALHYISPEQARGANLSPRSNIFSWGAILYQMVTGQRPFAAESAEDLRRKIIEEMPAPPHEVKKDVHPGLSQIIMKALAKTPADRYASGAELMRDVENYKRVEVVPPAPPKPAAPPPRPVTAQSPVADLRPRPVPVAPPPPVAAAVPLAPVANVAAPPPVIEKSAAASPAVEEPAAQAQPAVAAAAAPSKPERPAAPAKPAAATPASGPSKMLIYGMGGAIILLLAVIVIGAVVMRQSPATPESSATPGTASATPATSGTETTAPGTSQPVTPSMPIPGSSGTGASSGSSSRTAKGKQPPPEPPKPTVVQGQVQIDSAPQGAQIQIDGRQEPGWITPYTASLDPGKHSITLSMPGRMSATRSVDVASNKKTALAVGLAERAATISVSSDPAEATILLDGQSTGKVTPSQLVVAKGSHTVIVRKQGYLDASNTMDLAPGQAAQFAPTLKLSGSTQEIKTAGGIGGLFGGGSKDQGRVTVRSNPKGATVLVNGSAVKKTTPVDFFLNPGNYEITLVLSGHKPMKKIITVEKGGKLVVDETIP